MRRAEREWHSVAYFGDGGGDVCPCLRLKAGDTACARAGYPLAKALRKKRHACAVVEWATPEDEADLERLIAALPPPPPPTAAPPPPPTTAFLLLEHCNLNVADPEAAEAFYAGALGCDVNPASTNARQVHVNFGLCQFHLPYRTSSPWGEGGTTIPVTRSQVLRGRIDLASTTHENRATSMSCPWGNHIRLVPAGPSDAARVARFPARTGGAGRGGLVGISAVAFDVSGGASVPARVARFYARVFGAQIDARSGTVFVGGRGHAAGDVPLQRMSFRAVGDAEPERDVRTTDRGHHICLYMATPEAYRDAFSRCEALGLVWVNPRFAGPPMNDAVDTWPKAHAAGQFRIRHIVDANADGATVLHELEHEIRSPTHRSCPVRGASTQSLHEQAVVRGGLEPIM